MPSLSRKLYRRLREFGRNKWSGKSPQRNLPSIYAGVAKFGEGASLICWRYEGSNPSTCTKIVLVYSSWIRGLSDTQLDVGSNPTIWTKIYCALVA
jgi:hypothetical protein